MVEMLYGLKAIKTKFGTSAAAIRKWKAAGAPIILLNTGNGLRYRADYNKLYNWLQVKSNAHAKGAISKQGVSLSPPCGSDFQLDNTPKNGYIVSPNHEKPGKAFSAQE